MVNKLQTLAVKGWGQGLGRKIVTRTTAPLEAQPQLSAITFDHPPTPSSSKSTKLLGLRIINQMTEGKKTNKCVTYYAPGIVLNDLHGLSNVICNINRNVERVKARFLKGEIFKFLMYIITSFHPYLEESQ